MKKRVFIIHGWEGDSKEGWFPWLKKELEARGYAVTAPDMPDTENPKIETWVPYLAELVGEADKNTYFVGHSIGCQTIMRYLETLPAGQKAGGCIFVAGWFYLNNLEEDEEPVAEPWLTTPIDFQKVKRVCGKFKVILSDNDFFGAVEENRKDFEEKLGAEVIVEHNRGHFSGGDGVAELPSALQAILDLAKN